MDQTNYFIDTFQTTELNNFGREKYYKQSKDELIDQLLFYKNLERNGNVYYEKQPDNTLTLKGLLSQSTGFTYEELAELLDCGFTRDKKGQHRSNKKYNRNSWLLMVSKKLSTTYMKEHNGAKCPRTKKSKSTTELLSGISGLNNCYPIRYVSYVDDFLSKYPIDTWHLLSPKDLLSESFVYDESINKWICNNCNKKYSESSRGGHRLKCM